ncbi:unnamed protein product [Trichogramma brassicae]|uniref:Uncharacterized protein n=1 Tax=Trichogramma brassicae TaxID=86971 RepID=A0A6H5J604_9HYME|nr:unnamed protein product [Trichogramma brassicae]
MCREESDQRLLRTKTPQLNKSLHLIGCVYIHVYSAKWTDARGSFIHYTHNIKRRSSLTQAISPIPDRYIDAAYIFSKLSRLYSSQASAEVYSARKFTMSNEEQAIVPEEFDYDVEDNWFILKSLIENVNWEENDERIQFLHCLYPIALFWDHTKVNLKELFTDDQIECLLTDALSYPGSDYYPESYGREITELTADTGYLDEPKTNENGQILLRRTTPVHHAFKNNIPADLLQLFRIYNRFDLNYIDVETGITHFHVACAYGCGKVVEQFLEHGQDPNCLWTETSKSPLHLAVSAGHRDVIGALLRGGANPNLSDPEGLTALHVLCQRKFDDDGLVEFYLKSSRSVKVQVNVRADHLGRTPLQYAVANLLPDAVELLLDFSADISNFVFPDSSYFGNVHTEDDGVLANFELGLTFAVVSVVQHLENRGYELDPNDLREIFRQEEIEYLLNDFLYYRSKGLNKNLGKLFSEFVARSGYKDRPKVDRDGKTSPRRTTPIHHAARFIHDRSVPDLFEIYDQFEVNYTNDDGFTHLHAACRYGCDDIVEKFLERGQVDLNCATEKTGDTPLHLALWHRHEGVTESLLRRGANPNSTNALGWTPLHNICQTMGRNGDDDDLMRLFFELVDEMRQTVQVDARDNRGWTPLHFAAYGNDKGATESLLRRGAAPNLTTNDDGSTPLHLVCKDGRENDSVAEAFFKINDELRQTLRIDARDREGWTPLQWAVSNCKPNMVGWLLDRGADPSNFVIPAEGRIGVRLQREFNETLANLELRKVSGLMLAVERLVDRGYEMDRGAALVIMKFFAQQLDWFKKSVDLDACRHEATKITIKPSLSLWDLMQLRPQEAEKLVTYSNYFEFASSGKLHRVCNFSSRMAYVIDLCQKMCGAFCRPWALDPFWELIHHRLPLEICDMIVEGLTSQDWCNICLAAAGF